MTSGLRVPDLVSEIRINNWATYKPRNYTILKYHILKKLITFIPHNENTAIMEHHPKPSKGFIPEWYKDVPRLAEGAKKLIWPQNYQSPNLTVKICVPFLESMSNGYMVYLSDDIFVEQIDGYPTFRWHPSEKLIQTQRNMCR